VDFAVVDTALQLTGADAYAIGVFAAEQPPEGSPASTGAAQLLARGEARTVSRHLAVTHLDGVPLIVIGLGDRSAFHAEGARRVAATVVRRAQELGVGHLAWQLPPVAAAEATEIAEALVVGSELAAYRYTALRPAATEAEVQLTRMTVVGAAEPKLAGAVARAATLAAAQNRARDLANAPPNLMTPSALADHARALADRHPELECEIVPEPELIARGMGAFAAVAAGSAQEAQMIVLRYEGPGVAAGAPRLALVGKAVTFDSGGLNLKPGASMITMKFDMCGGAAVIEAVAALAQLAAPVRVLAVVGATENMTGAAAMRPGDVLTALDGTTIEMNNADAEGRLVLADCITHARREGCDAIVDVATLTGAAEVALGKVYAALMANDDALAQRLVDCGRRTGERLWQLPLHPAYAEMTKGRIAVRRTRPEPRGEAGASTAAEFLHHFAGDTPWAHLDMAGLSDNVPAPYFDKGGTGWGVRLLTELALGF
jgi:leucyl aminopeptidase